MHCPFCQAQDTKVIDSRLVGDGLQIRRRRECELCKARFNTFESADLAKSADSNVLNRALHSSHSLLRRI